MKMKPTRAQQLEALYAQLPAIDCSGRCWDSCGPIEMTKVERERIRRESGVDIPRGSFLHDTTPLMCPALSPVGRCTVYEIRPFICRLYGLSEGLPCLHGCEPERKLTNQEAYELMARAYEISGEHYYAELMRQAADPGNAKDLRSAMELVNTMTHVKLRRGQR